MTMIINALLVTSLFYITNSTVHYVLSENYQSAVMINNTHTLQHYLNNSKKYFISHVQLYFLPGGHHLNIDLILKDINNFTVTGKNFTISCTSTASITIVNVTDLKLQNINLVNCGKDQSEYFNSSYYSPEYKNDPNLLNKIGFNASILLYHCSSLIANNINITVKTSIIGLLAVNIRNVSILDHVSIQVISLLCPINQRQITSVLLCYNDSSNIYKKTAITIGHFHYEINKSCSNYLQYAITILSFHTKYPVKIVIQNTVFRNFSGFSMLFFYGEKLSNSGYNTFIRIDNCMVSYNTGNVKSKMFHFVHNSEVRAVDLHYSTTFYSIFNFRDCIFENNNKMEAMIYVIPAGSIKSSIVIKVYNVTFQNNKDITFLKVRSRTEILWRRTIYITLHFAHISSNQHQSCDSMISIINGIIRFFGSNYFRHNSFYDDLIKLHSSAALFRDYVELTGNRVRQILHTKSNSYVLIQEPATLNISNNLVYMIVKQTYTHNNDGQHICLIQFTSSRGNLDDQIKTLNCKIIMLNNEQMVSKNLIGKDLLYGDCTWVDSTAFKMAKANDVFREVLTANNLIVNSTSVRMIPLSVCICSSNNKYSNCYSPNVGSIFPGQTLTIHLKVSKQYLSKGDLSTTFVVANTPDDACTILNSHQLLQKHFNHGCNNYSYTVWPSNANITECKLFLGLKDMPEMLYVKMKPCPKGFILIDSKKSCYCDPLLDNNILSITSCNLDDGTILRPANSWISADTINKSHMYMISSDCPFYYCLPHSSYLNLSNPDSQCQYNRSGILCGHCQKDLSTVIGSLQCKKCSNVYLLIVIPIAIAGVALVVIIFISNLTVTNGTINIYIFYANVININYSMFCSNSHSVDCTLLSLINLDLGIETCFYNGMSDFDKMWLQLAFPFYLVLIAVVLIIGSRHSIRIQRLTARRVVQILATLFLLVYTKVLLTVCQVLFFFSQITHIPSKKTSLVWSIDTSVTLFGLKFCSIFVVCLILFLILLAFNVILLFPRTLSHIKFINTFKPLLDAYFAPYKDAYSFWTGLQLLMRAIFFALSAVGKDFSFIGGITLLGAMLCIQGIVHPTKSKLQNIKESLILFNLVMLYVTAILLKDNDDGIGKVVMIKLLFNIVLAYFFISIVVHCIKLKCGNVMKHRYYIIIKWLKSRLLHNSGQTRSLEVKCFSTEIPDVAYNYQEFREPLVAIKN